MTPRSIESADPCGRHTPTIVIALLLGSTSSCFDPGFGEGGFRCLKPPNACPDGYTCLSEPHPTEPGVALQICRPEGSAASKGPTLTCAVARDAVRAGENVVIAVSTTNFTLAPNAIGQPAVEGSGHVHVYLNRISSDTYLGLFGTPSGQVEIARGTRLGAHTLVGVLARNDHDLLDVTCTVDITVLPGI